MLSINTNLSSLIAQNSMQTSTNKLNQAIERMTTGFKINHAKDNAANYSISTNMTTKIGAYQVAEENTAMGMDMVSTASDTLLEMQNHATRLRALATQARNGTYGAQSLEAIQAEANALTAEIERLYNTAKFNGISLFNQKEYNLPENLKQAGTIDGERIEGKSEYNGFIINPFSYDEEYVNNLTAVSSETSTFTKDEYKIAEVKDLIKLAELTNAGEDTTGKIFILANDLDLGEYCDELLANNLGGWETIGVEGNAFKGTFDGNGHVIKNLKIDRGSVNHQGLFRGGQFKNVGVIDADVKGKEYVGILASASSSINNCFATGSATGTYYTGGLTGSASSISNSYADVTVTGTYYTGGLIAMLGNSISNCYALGNVKGYSSCGGLVGRANGSIRNCYAECSVVSSAGYVGGLAGDTYKDVINCYATGNVTGDNQVGGLVGCQSTVQTSILFENNYSKGTVNGKSYVGGLVGKAIKASGTVNFIGCSSYSVLSGNSSNNKGALIGGVVLTNDGTTFGKINITNCQVIESEMKSVGGVYQQWTLLPDYDMSAILAGVSNATFAPISTTLQIGLKGNWASQIGVTTNFVYNFEQFNFNINDNNAFNIIDSFLNILSEKQTELGSVQNRLESVLDEISIQYENLVSSRSTIKDADMAELSSTYIQQQILQQAAATLMSTANQSPAIALQLI